MPVDDEARELAASERISAALAIFDEATTGYDMWDPDLEEVRFEAMKTAIAKADAMRGCAAVKAGDVGPDGRSGEPQDDPDAGLTHWQIAEEIGALARDGRGIAMTVYAAIERAFQRGSQASRPAAPSPDRAGDGVFPNEAIQAALKVYHETHDTANVDDEPEDLDHAAMEFALIEAAKFFSNRKEVMPDVTEPGRKGRASGSDVTRPREEVRASGGAKILASLEDALGFAQGDKSRGKLLHVKYGELVELDDEEDQSSGFAAAIPSGGWMPIETAPAEGEFLVGLWVRRHDPVTRELILKYEEQHVIAIDDETGEIDFAYEQGWKLSDYEFWKPLDPLPPASADGDPQAEDAGAAESRSDASAVGRKAETPRDVLGDQSVGVHLGPNGAKVIEPKHSPEPNHPMSVEEARSILKGLDPNVPYEEHVSSLIWRAEQIQESFNHSLHSHYADALVAEAHVIEAALRTLSENGEVRS